jgi:hypothetical protein
MVSFEKLLPSILQTESVRLCIYGLVLFILYHILVKKGLEKTLNDIKNFSTEMDAIKKTLLTMLYANLKELFSSAIRRGGKTYEEDETFKDLWDNYVKLGDGHGDELYTKWQSLKYIVGDINNE